MKENHNEGYSANDGHHCGRSGTASVRFRVMSRLDHASHLFVIPNVGLAMKSPAPPPLPMCHRGTCRTRRARARGFRHAAAAAAAAASTPPRSASAAVTANNGSVHNFHLAAASPVRSIIARSKCRAHDWRRKGWGWNKTVSSQLWMEVIWLR